MKIYKTRTFDKWARKNKVSDIALAQAALDVSNGKVEANLGGAVYKKRIATKGRGKSGSVRTILAFKISTDCFYIFGYEKNEKSNVSRDELRTLQLIAKGLFAKGRTELLDLVKEGALIEVKNEQIN